MPKTIKLSKSDQRLLAQRTDLWPTVKEEQLWNRGQDGYGSVPRTLPLLLEIIDAASKRVSSGGKAVPAGRAYLALWCRATDVSMVKVSSEVVLALETGYAGQRATLTWREHVRVLLDLGFIRTAPGAEGDHSFVLLMNPYQVCAELASKGWIADRLKNALEERKHEIRAIAGAQSEVSQ